jgi:hypothetical protein
MTLKEVFWMSNLTASRSETWSQAYLWTKSPADPQGGGMASGNRHLTEAGWKGTRCEALLWERLEDPPQPFASEWRRLAEE